MGDQEFNDRFQAAAGRFGEPHHDVDTKLFQEQARHRCFESCQDDASMKRMVQVMAETHTTVQIQGAYS